MANEVYCTVEWMLRAELQSIVGFVFAYESAATAVNEEEAVVRMEQRRDQNAPHATAAVHCARGITKL